MALGVVGNEDGDMVRAWIIGGLVCNLTNVRKAHELKPDKDPFITQKKRSRK